MRESESIRTMLCVIGAIVISFAFGLLVGMTSQPLALNLTIQADQTPVLTDRGVEWYRTGGAR